MQTITILTQNNGFVKVEIKEGQDINKLAAELQEKYGTFIQI